MTAEIRATRSPGETRVAALQDGELIDYAIDRPGARDGVGDLLRGRVGARAPAMAGCFVVLPDRADGFLPDSEGAAGLGPGDTVAVRVVRAAQGGKGPRLSARGIGQEPGPPGLLAPGPDAIARLLALHPGSELIIDDPVLHRAGARLVRRAWDAALEAAVAALAEPQAALPGGILAHIQPTRALVAIDLDLPATAERQPKAHVQRAANRAALPGLARQIRLRNLSGAILIDPAGMAVRARAGLLPGLAEALAGDPLQPRLLGLTGLGLIEVVRPRVHPPLHALVAGPHAAGLRALRALDAAQAADPAARLRLRAAAEVARLLEQDTCARDDLARRTGRPLMVLSDPGLGPGQAFAEPIAP